MPILSFESLISKRLNALKLSPKDSLERAFAENKEFFSSVCVDASGKPCFFKATLIPNGAIKQLEIEINIYKKFSQINHNNTFFILPKLNKINIGKKFGWLVRSYIDGENFGNWETGFNTSVLKNSAFAENLANGIYFAQCHLTNLTDKNFLKSLDISQIQKKTSSFLELLKPHLKIDFAETLDQLYRERIGGYQLVFSHGGLTPKNLIQVKKQPGIIDWKNALLTNPAFDLSSLWVYSLNNENWQRVLVNTYLNLSSNQWTIKQLLKINNLYHLSQLLYRFYNEKKQSRLKKTELNFYNLIQRALIKLLQ